MEVAFVVRWVPDALLSSSALSTSVPPIRNVTSRPDTDTTSTGTSSIRADWPGARRACSPYTDSVTPSGSIGPTPRLRSTPSGPSTSKVCTPVRLTVQVPPEQRLECDVVDAPTGGQRQHQRERGGGEQAGGAVAGHGISGGIGRSGRLRVSSRRPEPITGARLPLPREASTTARRRAGRAPARVMVAADPREPRAEAERAAGPAVDRHHLIRFAPA